MSNLEKEELIIALEEVRDDIFPFISNRNIELVVERHVADEHRPALHMLVSEALGVGGP